MSPSPVPTVKCITSSSTVYPTTTITSSSSLLSHGLFPSIRLLIVGLLCCCFCALSISISNIAVTIVCMTHCENNDSIADYNGTSSLLFDWSSSAQGFIFAAQNVGSLMLLATGYYANRLNAKLMIAISLIIGFFANIIICQLAVVSIYFVIFGRLLIGVADAILQPSVSLLIVRWFPMHERSFAIGFITGGRQIGSLIILPTAGYLCTKNDWPSVFYLSAAISASMAVVWLIFGADQPTKHCLITTNEIEYLNRKILRESNGRGRLRVPWKKMIRSKPLAASIFALICHEYPLVIMLQLLPTYLYQILGFSPTSQGLLTALPIGCLWLSKMLSSSLSSFIISRSVLSLTTIVKAFNGIASVGLAVSIGIVPLFNESNALSAIVALCAATTFAGLHTPGVQTALLHLAPSFNGIITGISFFLVAIVSILNKMLATFIIRHGRIDEWLIVFEVAAVIALFPVVVFTIWGSAERQSWANAPSQQQHRSLVNMMFETLQLVIY